MLYKFRDGINYLTFADKMWIELCSNKSSIKKKSCSFQWYKSFECSAVNSLKFL